MRDLAARRTAVVRTSHSHSTGRTHRPWGGHAVSQESAVARNSFSTPLGALGSGLAARRKVPGSKLRTMPMIECYGVRERNVKRTKCQRRV